MNETTFATVGVLRAQCSWCGTLLRAGVEPTTHGICGPCSDAMLEASRARAQVRANRAAIAPRVLAWRDNVGGSSEPTPVGPLPRALPGPDTLGDSDPCWRGDQVPRAVAAGRPDRDEPARPTRFLIESPARLRTFVRDNWATLILVSIVLALNAWHVWGAR